MKPLYSATLLVLSISLPANAETKFFFEIPGEHKRVGSWSLTVQENAGVMVMLGESRLRKFPNTLETSAPESGLQITCNAGVISIIATLSEGKMLKSGAYEGNFGHYILWVNDERVGVQKVPLSNLELEGDNLIVPILSLRQENDNLSRLLNAKTISVRAAPMEISKGMITATYSPSQTREAFSYLSNSCGWS